jgi:HNH endonuclease
VLALREGFDAPLYVLLRRVLGSIEGGDEGGQGENGPLMPFKDPAVRAAYDVKYAWTRRMQKHRKRTRGGRVFLVTERDWRRLVARYLGRCHWCGSKPDRLEMDHLYPLSRGGDHSIGNIVPSCPDCNSYRGNQWPAAFRLFGPEDDPEF